MWEAHGVAGIHKLRGKLSLGDLDGGFQRLMSLSRGAPDLGRELGMQEALSAPASAEKTPRVSTAPAVQAAITSLQVCMEKRSAPALCISWALQAFVGTWTRLLVATPVPPSATVAAAGPAEAGAVCRWWRPELHGAGHGGLRQHRQLLGKRHQRKRVRHLCMQPPLRLRKCCCCPLTLLQHSHKPSHCMLQAELQGQAGAGLGLLQHGCMRCLASL